MSFENPIETHRFPTICDYSIIDREPIDRSRIRGIVFCATHRLIELFKILPEIDGQITLVSSQLHGTACSDYNLHKAYLDRAPWPKIIHWYAKNMLVEDQMVSPLPIGLMVGKKIGFMKEQFGKGAKRHFMYVNFEINTNHGEREPAHTIANEVKGALVLSGRSHQRDFFQYILDVRDSEYVLCPPGSGIDTWRFWECLYMGSIPIVQRSPMTEYYAELFPIVQVDFWEELHELPPASRPSGNYREKLDFNYWKDLICAV